MTGQYRYDECGLDNVILVGLEACTDDAGEAVITIPNVGGLHRAIATSVACKKTGLNGKEIRFLRTELGLTQAELAEIITKDAQTVGRWERGEHPIDQTAETVFRALVLQRLGDGGMPPIEELARRNVQSSGERPFFIDASNPANYHEVELEAA